MATATIRLEHPVDLRRTVFPLVRGDGDPTARVEGRTVTRAVRTPDGPATVRLTQTATTRIDADAVGPGTEHALAVTAPGLAGAFDDPGAFTAIEPIDPVIAAAWREHRNVLLSRAEPFPVLIAAILEQKVTGIEARKAWRQIVRRTSDAAPGDMGLFLPPDPERLAAIPGWELTRLGVTGQRAETLREAARHGRADARAVGAVPRSARAGRGAAGGLGDHASRLRPQGRASFVRLTEVSPLARGPRRPAAPPGTRPRARARGSRRPRG